METPQPQAEVPPASAPPARWRLLLAIVVLMITGLLVLAAAQFPPRTPPPYGTPCPTCYSFSVVAGIGGALSFNGSVPGPAMAVPVGASVTVKLIVDSAASGPHSWMLVPRNGTSSSSVVFPGANTTNPSVGTAPGSSATASFIASAAGTYMYICGVDAHYADMWGYFNVTG